MSIRELYLVKGTLQSLAGLKLHFPLNYDINVYKLLSLFKINNLETHVAYRRQQQLSNKSYVFSVFQEKRGRRSSTLCSIYFAPPLMDKNHLACLSKQNLSTSSTTVLLAEKESRQECSCIYLVGTIKGREEEDTKLHGVVLYVVSI